MNRREWLQTVFGAAVAAAVAPLVDLTDTTPAFWAQPEIVKLKPWRIMFPDGTTFSFHGTVLSETILEDLSDGARTAQFEIQASGPVEIMTVGGGGGGGPKDPPKLSAPATTVFKDGIEIADISEIQLPSLQRTEFDAFSLGDGDDVVIPGLRRMSPITLTVRMG